ncbi:Uncharacterized protein ALO79_00162 [Pseudomonas syringae pv. castaneae]|uniref:Uncharacterized protein n=1 Tax=Pseudomonas syringae pv. castaneae TaxID=264450 RepID=A0A0P9NFM7_PSESX|nr:Uncharacterized protein ALO79_00162 [Pseudomonas syringae pv. castaneae]KWS91520.1 hypothetical protein AL048_03675 [Pseudomonas syringae pv. castaneae]
MHAVLSVLNLDSFLAGKRAIQGLNCIFAALCLRFVVFFTIAEKSGRFMARLVHYFCFTHSHLGESGALEHDARHKR